MQSWVRVGGGAVALAATMVMAGEVGCSSGRGQTGSADLAVATPDLRPVVDFAIVPDLTPPGPQDFVVNLVHASPDTGPIGLCVGTATGGGSVVSFPPPFDNVRVLSRRYGGTQVAVSEAESAALVNTRLRIYAVPLPGGGDGGVQTCQDATRSGVGAMFSLVGEYNGGFEPGRGYLLALTGCKSVGTGTVARCGAEVNAPTQPRPLRTFLRELDRSAVPSSSVGAQAVQLAPGLEVQGAGGSPDGGAVSDAGAASDGGAPPSGAGIQVALGQLSGATTDAGPLSAEWDLSLTGTTPLTFAFGVSPSVVGPVPADFSQRALGLFVDRAPLAVPSMASATYTFSLPAIAVETLGSGSAGLGSFWKGGERYTFVVVGDPTVGSDPQAGSDALRVLAFPNRAR
jgi:hypothetical protein